MSVSVFLSLSLSLQVINLVKWFHFWKRVLCLYFFIGMKLHLQRCCRSCSWQIFFCILWNVKNNWLRKPNCKFNSVCNLWPIVQVLSPLLFQSSTVHDVDEAMTHNKTEILRLWLWFTSSTHWGNGALQFVSYPMIWHNLILHFILEGWKLSSSKLPTFCQLTKWLYCSDQQVSYLIIMCISSDNDTREVIRLYVDRLAYVASPRNHFPDR